MFEMFIFCGSSDIWHVAVWRAFQVPAKTTVIYIFQFISQSCCSFHFELGFYLILILGWGGPSGQYQHLNCIPGSLDGRSGQRHQWVATLWERVKAPYYLHILTGLEETLCTHQSLLAHKHNLSRTGRHGAADNKRDEREPFLLILASPCSQTSPYQIYLSNLPPHSNHSVSKELACLYRVGNVRLAPSFAFGRLEQVRSFGVTWLRKVAP